MEALSRRLLRVRTVLGFCASLFIHVANAQYPVIDRLELAFAQGASDSVIVQLSRLLGASNTSRDLRYEACMLMAECYYQRASMEQFAAWNDSAAALVSGQNEQRLARIDVNRCRYANFFIKPHQALAWGNKALIRYRNAVDRSRWKHGYAIYQALGTTHRNIHGGQEVLFALFDTAQSLLERRSDVIPYWQANLHKSISNAAMDRLVSGFYDSEPYGPICDRQQLAAIRILEANYPTQLTERGTLQNLRGLYHIYSDRPDSARWWFQRTEVLVGPAYKTGHNDDLASTWLTGLRYSSFVLDQEPWRNDKRILKTFLLELTNAQDHFTSYLDSRATAGGLFFDDQYWISPFPTIMATCSRLWELTGDTTYIEQALWATEKSRRDAWNTAQSIRGKTTLLGDPPPNMLRSVREHLSQKEAVLVCAQSNLGGLKEKLLLLAITRDTVAFIAREPKFPLRITAHLDHKTTASYRSEYHLLHNEVYLPVAPVLRKASRIRVLPSGDAAFVAFDALLADTNSKEIRRCNPLVERHAFSYPMLLIAPNLEEAKSFATKALYIAPAPGTGQLTDLKRMRSALRGWAMEAEVDSSFRESEMLLEFPSAAEIYLAGHCAGGHERDNQPRHYFSTDTSNFWIEPSDLLPLDLRADLVVHLACKSGLFEADRSGSAISFSRAFLLAGARNVVSSQYLADEASSIRLVDLFREELTKGLPKDVALQRAKLTYLDQCVTEEDQMPLHWAGWQVLGEPERIEEDSGSGAWWLLIASLIGILGLAGYFRFR
ncbi:MAG: CHAT domain-containing protein [Flavobacteriales bacterium]|nr:CHAT domain-containing protein [Flavobacteriales bacterium]